MGLLVKAQARLDTALGGSDALRRLVQLGGWTFASFGIEKAASVLILFLLARLLGATDYGRFTLAQGLVNTLQIAIVLGAGAVLARYLPAVRRDGFRRVVEIVNLCGLVVAGSTVLFLIVGLGVGRPWTIEALDLTASSNMPSWILTWIVASAGASLMTTVLLSLEQGRALGLVSLFSALGSVFAVAPSAWSFGLTGAIISLVVVECCKLGLVTAMYCRLVAAEGVSLLTPPRRTDIPLLTRFGLPMSVASALWGPALWLAQLLVSTRAPEGLAAVGVFGFANNVLGAVILISSLSNRAALPVYASLHADGRELELRRVAGQIALVQVGLAAALALPLTIAAPWIMASVGPAFAAHWPVLVLMIGTGVLIAGQTAVGNYLLVTDRQVFVLASVAPWGVILLSSAYFLPQWGALSLAGGLFFASLVHTVLFLGAFSKAGPTGTESAA